MKKCYIVAGPNGAGKTTFARTYLPKEVDCLNFVNADLIAEGISPLQPEAAAIEAGKMLLRRIEEFVANGESFAFETTLSGLSYTRRIPSWREEGYRIVLFYLKTAICRSSNRAGANESQSRRAQCTRGNRTEKVHQKLGEFSTPLQSPCGQMGCV